MDPRAQPSPAAPGYGFIVWNYLTDTSADAAWLSQAEKEGLAGRLRSEHDRKQAEGSHTVRAAFSNGWVWFFSLLYFAIILGQWGIGFWLPQIVTGEFPGASGCQVSLLSAAPWVVALTAIVPVARHSDRTGERRWHLAVPCAVAALGVALSA